MTGAGRRPMLVAWPQTPRLEKGGLGLISRKLFCDFGGFLPDAACPIGRQV